MRINAFKKRVSYLFSFWGKFQWFWIWFVESRFYLNRSRYSLYLSYKLALLFNLWGIFFLYFSLLAFLFYFLPFFNVSTSFFYGFFFFLSFFSSCFFFTFYSSSEANWFLWWDYHVWVHEEVECEIRSILLFLFQKLFALINLS